MKVAARARVVQLCTATKEGCKYNGRGALFGLVCLHFAKQSECLVYRATINASSDYSAPQSVNQSIPCHDISFRHFIKHILSLHQAPTFHIEIDQRCTNIHILFKTVPFRLLVDSRAGFEILQSSAGLEDERVGVLGGLDAGAHHLTVQIEGRFERPGPRVGPDQLVPQYGLALLLVSWDRVENSVCELRAVAGN
ncbi:3-bisphosphoglycerate-independent phosphoglycerate mutase, partial [Striga asiatica]